jgi:hypothetical protein
MLRVWGVLALALAASPALAECKLHRAQSPAEAKLIVFFTRFETEDKTGGKYKRCRLLAKAEPGSEAFVITEFRKDANVVVHRSNWPR